LILLFRSKINAASNSKCKQIRENLLRVEAAMHAQSGLVKTQVLLYVRCLF